MQVIILLKLFVLLGGKELDLCVAVSNRKTPYGRSRTGLCSGFLSTIAVGDTLQARVRPGCLRSHPTLLDEPIL